MTYEKTKFCCSLCNTEYHSLENAEKCEALGEPEIKTDLEIGEDILFEAEVIQGESTGSAQISGTVIDKDTVLAPRERKHIQMLFVEHNGPQGRKAEFGVLAILDEEGKERWISPLPNRLKVGATAIRRASIDKSRGGSSEIKIVK